MTELRAKWRKDGRIRSGRRKGRWWARYHTHINQSDPITGAQPPYFKFTKIKWFWDNSERLKFIKEQNEIAKNCSTDEEYVAMYDAIETLTKD